MGILSCAYKRLFISAIRAIRVIRVIRVMRATTARTSPNASLAVSVSMLAMHGHRN